MQGLISETIGSTKTILVLNCSKFSLNEKVVTINNIIHWTSNINKSTKNLTSQI